MPIDINEDIKVWGGFTPMEFWAGASILVLLALIALSLGARTSALWGGIFFFASGGSFFGFMVYRRSLPKGLLLRRFLQDGRFLFITIPWIKAPTVYHPWGRGRAERFREQYGSRDE